MMEMKNHRRQEAGPSFSKNAPQDDKVVEDDDEIVGIRMTT